MVPPSRRRRGLYLLLALVLLAAGAYAILAMRAQPFVPDHPFFAEPIGHPLVIAHRGSALLWPENTIHAFQQAAALGADVLEMDLHTTADGVLVILHDATVDRTTDGTGRIRELELAEVKRLDAGYRWTRDGGRTFPYRGTGLTIPRLEEVFTALPGSRFNLEIKQVVPTLVPQLCRTIREFGMQHRVLLASFHAEPVRAFRAECPEVATSATASEARWLVALQFLPNPPYAPAAQALQVPERLGRLRVLTRRLVEVAHARNLQVHAFTINEAEDMRRLLDLGVDGFVTDRPDLLLDLLGRGRRGESVTR